MSIVSDLSNYLFPRQCVMCGRRLSVSERSMCAACLMQLPRTELDGREQNVLERLFWKQFPIERATAFIHYTGKDVKHILHKIKYFDRPTVGRDLAQVAAEELTDTAFFEGIDCIVPVPVHWMRRLKRGYNQCQYIADGIARATGLPIVSNAVKRTVNNRSQTHVARQQRKDNTAGIFKLTRPELLRGKHILLVDDVVTTGSTIASCAKELALAEGVRISIFALAMAVPEHVPATNDNTPEIQIWGMPLIE